MSDPRPTRIAQVKQELARYSGLANMAAAQGHPLPAEAVEACLALSRELRQLESTGKPDPA